MREPLESLRQQIDEFSQRAAHNLAQLLKERKALEPKPGSSKAAQTPRRKIIKTRFNSVVVGEPRQTEARWWMSRRPLTGRVIATFHEKDARGLGRTSALRTPGTTVRRPGDQHHRRPGRASEKNRPPPCGPWATPKNQDAFRWKSKRCSTSTPLAWSAPWPTIEAALTRLNLTESDRPSAATLNQQLNVAAERLYELGTQTRVGMTKQQAPTAARVEWLHGLGQVKITKVVSRRRLKGPGKDFSGRIRSARPPDSSACCGMPTFTTVRQKRPSRTIWPGTSRPANNRSLGASFGTRA